MDQLIREAERRVGTVLRERWTIDELIGVGGMAAVYKATHRNGNEVAIKILHSDVSDNTQVRKRFQREGYVANRVKHPSAVTVFDDDVTEDGCAFLVMELLRGENVETRRARLGGFVPLPEVLGIADQVLDVLAAAHEQGIVHRDIKPENLFLTTDGVVKVLDFGIARLQSSGVDTRLTMAGAMMGTPGFMSPEQAGGFTDRIDGQTDIWCMGATLFTLLCGQHVHPAESLNENVLLSATKPARSLSSVLPDLDAAVAALVDRALCWDKRGRWADARSMQGELRRVAHRVLGHSRVGSSPALELTLSEPLSSPSARLVPGGMSDPEGPTRVAPMPTPEPGPPSGPTRVAPMPTPEPEPLPAGPVSEEPPTHRVAKTLPPLADSPRASSVMTWAGSPRAMAAILLAALLLAATVVMAVWVGTVMKQRKNDESTASSDVKDPPAVELVPEPDPRPATSTAQPVPEAEADAAVTEKDASTIAHDASATERDAYATGSGSDAGAPPKPPVQRRWYKKKKKRAPTGK